MECQGLNVRVTQYIGIREKKSTQLIFFLKGSDVSNSLK